MTKKSAAKGNKKSSPAPAPAAESNRLGKGYLADAMIGSGVTRAQAEKAVDSMAAAIVEGLRKGSSITLPGVGTLSVRETTERQGVRPGTSEKITIPAGKKIGFKISSTLKGTL